MSEKSIYALVEGTLYGDIDRRIAEIRRKMIEDAGYRLAFAKQLAPVLDEYRKSKTPFTAYSVGRKVFGSRYYCNGNGDITLPAKIGIFLMTLNRMGETEEVTDLCNPHCPMMYRFV